VPHTFTHRARTSSTASGKPVFTTLKYILTLTTNAYGLSFTSTIDDDIEEADDVIFADVHGQITLESEPFDTTRVTMSASVQLAASSDEIEATRLGDLKTSRLVKKATAVAPQLAHATLDHLLSCIPHPHTRFARYDEIDEATYAKFERDIPAAAPVRARENALCDESRAYDDQVRKRPKLRV